MDSKDVWVAAKFLVAATGLKRRDARKMLDEIPPDRYARLFIMSKKWESELRHQASKDLELLLGDTTLATLQQAIELAKVPSGPGSDDESDEEPEEPPKKRRAGRRQHAAR